MMNLSAIMGRIAGKGVDSGAQPGASVPGETGIATGGSFAALVQFATQAGPRTVQGELGLVAGAAGLPSAASSTATPAAAPDSASALMGEVGVAPSAPATASPTGGEAALWTQFAATAPALQGKAGAANPGRAPQTDANALAVADPMAPAGPVTPLGDAVSAETTQAAPGEGDAPTGADGASQAQTPAQAQTQIFGIPTGAAAMAALAPWSGQQVAAETAPSSPPEEGASPALGIASTAPIATLAQAAAAPEARSAKGGARFVAQPTIVTPTPPGAANPESQTGDAADTGTAAGRTSEQTATTIGATPATGLSATGTGVPLRMIVDSLPPGIQSALTVGGVATVSGPSTGQQLGDQVIDMGVSGQWIDRMAREITALAEGSGHSRFTLNPPHLGRLQVDLWQGQDATSVRLLTETDEAARRLGEGRSALHADARMAALNLGSITIEKAAQSHDSARDSGNHRTGAESQMQQQATGQGQGNGQGQARSGNNQPQGEWVGRAFRHDQDQQGEASPSAAARRAASDHVRFA